MSLLLKRNPSSGSWKTTVFTAMGQRWDSLACVLSHHDMTRHNIVQMTKVILVYDKAENSKLTWYEHSHWKLANLAKSRLDTLKSLYRSDLLQSHEEPKNCCHLLYFSPSGLCSLDHACSSLLWEPAKKCALCLQDLWTQVVSQSCRLFCHADWQCSHWELLWNAHSIRTVSCLYHSDDITH